MTQTDAISLYSAVLFEASRLQTSDSKRLESKTGQLSTQLKTHVTCQYLYSETQAAPAKIACPSGTRVVSQCILKYIVYSNHYNYHVSGFVVVGAAAEDPLLCLQVATFPFVEAEAGQVGQVFQRCPCSAAATALRQGLQTLQTTKDLRKEP